MNDGGYERPEFWLSDGWDAIQRYGLESTSLLGAGIFRRPEDIYPAGLREVEAVEPVCHVSYFEAEAYSHWAGARLATEGEWEHVARWSRYCREFCRKRALSPAFQIATGGLSQVLRCLGMDAKCSPSLPGFKAAGQSPWVK